MKMKKSDLIPIMFWVGLGLFSMTLSYELGLGRFNDPGPGLMPFLVSLLLLLVSVLFFISFFFETSAKFERQKESKEQQGNPNFLRIVLVVGSLFIYALLFERLGYIISTLLLLIFLFKGVGYKWKLALINSISIVLITYLLFTYLGVRFPTGFFKLGGFVR